MTLSDIVLQLQDDEPVDDDLALARGVAEQLGVTLGEGIRLLWSWDEVYRFMRTRLPPHEFMVAVDRAGSQAKITTPQGSTHGEAKEPINALLIAIVRANRMVKLAKAPR